jgi:release factor glutamine methyltransferase
MIAKSAVYEIPVRVGDLVKVITGRLKTESSGLDAQVLLAEVLNTSRTWLAAHPETRLSPAQLESVEATVARLEAGEPLPYIIGHWEFFGLDLSLTPDVLIPRPETELLVEKAISYLQAYPARRSVADVGTGSGAIGISIATHIPSARIIATDISDAALQVAKQNAHRFRVAEQIDFLNCDLLPPIGDQRFDLICANLPYIPTEMLQGLAIYGREPTIALDGGADGLDLIRRLLSISIDQLAPHGSMLLEIESTQGAKAMALAHATHSTSRIRLHRDLAGHDRLLEISR